MRTITLLPKYSVLVAIYLTARTITTHNNTINAEIPERFQE